MQLHKFIRKRERWPWKTSINIQLNVELQNKSLEYDASTVLTEFYYALIQIEFVWLQFKLDAAGASNAIQFNFKYNLKTIHNCLGFNECFILNLKIFNSRRKIDDLNVFNFFSPVANLRFNSIGCYQNVVFM